LSLKIVTLANMLVGHQYDDRLTPNKKFILVDIIKVVFGWTDLRGFTVQKDEFEWIKVIKS